jgi:hypothetical protein
MTQYSMNMTDQLEVQKMRLVADQKHQEMLKMKQLEFDLQKEELELKKILGNKEQKANMIEKY